MGKLHFGKAKSSANPKQHLASAPAAPVEKVVERIVEVERLVEKRIEVPVERIVEVPVERIVEVIKEVKVEVPVEKIVTQERIIEVPVTQHLVKEVPVEKIVKEEVERVVVVRQVPRLVYVLLALETIALIGALVIR